VGEELRFIRGQVDVDRTLAFAALAGEAQVERLLHRFLAPAAAQRLPLQHLE